MGEKTTKTVKLPESKAKEWDDYKDENEAIDSISHLIRLSVERQMQGKYNQPEAPSGNSDAAESGEVLTALRKIQTSVEGLEERLSAIEEVNEAEANYDLRKAVYSFLPEERDSPEYDTWATTAEEVARKLGAEVDDVENTLEGLEEGTGQVASVTGGPDGETYWFKRGK